MSQIMAARAEYSRVTRLLPMFAGGVLVGAAFLADVFVEGGAPSWVRNTLVMSGCAFPVLGLASRHRRFSAALAKVALALLASVFLLAMAEVGFRAAKFDFERLNDPGAALPISYRTPTLHAGEGIFRRPGPASWQGRPLSAFLRIRWGSESPFTNEEPVVIEYDALGFRNPAGLTDWEVVVAGDSFVELGFLPYEELFTTLAAQRLGVRIKNLGVSGTGPLSQMFYVQNYGRGASTKDAVLCFFEGNDLSDLDREIRSIETFHATGQPLEPPRQMSLLKALCEQARRRSRPTAATAKGITPNAVVVGGPVERSMTVGVNPPVWDRLSRKKQELVERTMAAWAETARARGMRPWVMCLPDSHRVFHGHLRYAETNSLLALWKPGEFAPHLAKICADLNIGFFDPFPALRREVEAGRVPYNLVGDNHLNASGSHVVADVLAEALRSVRAR